MEENMEANRCSRCGSFYVSINGDVCPKCMSKENLEFSTFKTYIEQNNNINSVDTIATATGISQKNVNRFLDYEGIAKPQNNNAILENIGIVLN